MKPSRTRQSVGILRATVGALPGVKSLYESLHLSPGSWLYRRPTIDWLSYPAMRRQLPMLYRVFARYCAARRNDPRGAEAMLRAIIALSRSAGSEAMVPLQIDATIMFVDLQDPRFLRVPSELKEVSRVLSRFLNAGDSFIDIGANQGTFSVVASGLVGANGIVIAIEPQPRLANLLRRSLLRGPAPFEIHQIACGDRPDEVEFYIPVATSGAAGRFGDYSAISLHRTIKVALRRIDDVIDSRNLRGRAFVKLDVEGSELSALIGARETIRAIRPPILIEINPDAMRAANSSKAALLKTLIDLGYDRFLTLKDFERAQPLTEHLTESDLILLPADYPHGII
jgi:FkbM family methyltransferase